MSTGLHLCEYSCLYARSMTLFCLEKQKQMRKSTVVRNMSTYRACLFAHTTFSASFVSFLFATWSQEYPDYIAYTTPLFFCDDWLNLYLDNYRMHKDPDVYSESNEISCSDYRFVYMGEKGMSRDWISTSISQWSWDIFLVTFSFHRFSVLLFCLISNPQVPDF